MPNRDGTGPTGKGSRTGRGMGPCNPKGPKKQDQRQSFGKGAGRGFGRRFNSSADEK